MLTMLDRIAVLSLAAYDHRTLMRHARRAADLGFWAFWYAGETFECVLELTAEAAASRTDTPIVG